MGLYNFKEQFVEPIVSGLKRQTIRAERRYPDKPGNTMHLYTGLRTKHVHLIGTAICTSVDPVEIWDHLSPDDPAGIKVFHGELSPVQRDAFAYSDGFKDWAEMLQFWRALPRFHGRGFYGAVYRWEKLII